MSFNRWLRNLHSSIAPDPVRREHRRRSLRTAATPLYLEVLEDRRLLSFSPAVTYPAGLYPQAVQTADLNGDGKLDLAVVNAGANSVGVLLGNLDGTFQPAQNFATGFAPHGIAVGDFNADGKLDLATGNDYDLSVLLGNGDGTFQPTSNTVIAQDPQSLSVAVGDFNSDGKLDLGVTSNHLVPYAPSYSGYYYHYEGQASVLLGNGDGSFAAPNTTNLGPAVRSSAAVADFNGDAKLDFATVNSDYGTVSVLLGDGLGNLSGPIDFDAGPTPWLVVTGDVNGDFKADLVTADGVDNVNVMLGDGLGGFAAAQAYAVGDAPDSVVLGDFDHDTRLDIATANYGSSDLSVLRGIGNGAFLPAVNAASGASPWGVAAGDFNGDGWLDAATASYNAGNISVLINDHSWPPPPPPSVSISDVTVTEGNTGTASATFNVSVSTAYGQQVTVHYATADGTATAGADYTGASGDVTFAPGEFTKSISVVVLGDRAAEPTETFVVNLSAPANATVSDGQAIGTILDNEPRIGIGNATMTEGNAGSVAFAFAVRLSVAYDVPVTIGYATADGTATAGGDYQAASGTLTIPAGQTSGIVTVLVNGDRLAEPNETFSVNLSNPNYGVITGGQGVGTIVDDEPRLSINSVSVKEGNGGTKLSVCA